MRVNIPWWYPSMGTQEAQAVLEVLESGYVNDGEWTRRLQRVMADNRDSCRFVELIGVVSGTGVGRQPDTSP